MPQLKFGRVKFFLNNPAKLFGFIISDDDKVEFFFHFNAGKEPNPTGMYDWYDIDTAAPREPKAGDRIAFEPRKLKVGDKGPAVKYWAFEEDYKRIRVTEAPEEQVKIISEGRYLYHLQDIAKMESEKEPSPVVVELLKKMKAEAAAFKAANPDEAEKLEARNKELAA